MSSKGGRPKKEIDWDLFEKLCAIHCTLIEISDILGVSHDTLERACKKRFRKGFAYVSRQKAAKGKMSLRRKQYSMAMDGNVTLLIWLGKQWLGQKDKHEFSDADDDSDPKDDLKYVPRPSIVWNKPKKE